MAVAGSGPAYAQPAASSQTQPAPATEAREPTVTWGAEVDLSSRYLWHGLPFSTGAVVWPSAWVSAKGFTASLWTNFDRDYVNTTRFNPNGLTGPTFNEYDVSLGYERTVRKLTVTGTFSRYVYLEPAGVLPQSTSEVIARVEYSAGPGEIFSTQSWDVEKHRGAYYVDFGYGVEREIHPKTTLKMDGSVSLWPGFADEYAVSRNGPWGPATVNVALVRQLTRFSAVRPHMTFVRILDDVARGSTGTPGFTFGAALVFGIPLLP
jgi:hypothetical protein